jgi:signal transduction histidine kinase
LKLVNALLDFSRLEAGRLRGRFAPADLGLLTRDLVVMFQTAFDRAGLTLTIDCPALSGPFWVDRDMWEKIVPNLVSNAFKFTLAGEVTVRLRQTDTHAVLEVSDTGTGIPEAEVPRVFERFHRVSGAVGRTHEGAGIGLALVRELVELHGGTIEVASRLGLGTTFRLAIPSGFAHLPPDDVVQQALADQVPDARNALAAEAVRLADSAALSEAPPALPPNALAAAASREVDAEPLVLVVDDNAELREYMSSLLRPHYRVVTAQDGMEALDLILAHAPDIVVSDVMMPRMTGIELVQALRANATATQVPIILLSARAGEESTIEGLDAGSDDYLTKPFTASELLARVRAHLKLGRARRKWTAELELANRELDAFSYSVAHDLRGPLRSIDGFSQLLLQEHATQLGDQGRRHLDMVRGSAQRMSRVIDDLLRLAQMSRGAVRQIRFELSSLVHTVASQLSQGEPERHVELRIEPGVHVEADPHLLQIVLENLLRNAWKFSAGRTPAVIEFGAEAFRGETCYFVRDNGAGFDMAYSSKLFGVFQRLHSDAEFQGTGVGLATVKRIIGRHGGRVWAVGEVDRGATFYFTLTPADVSRNANERG